MTDSSQQASLARRRLLRGAGAAGLAAAAIAAEQIARPAPALAGTDGDVVLGQDNSTSDTTTILMTSGADAFHGFALADGVGVTGDSDSGNGIAGGSNSGTGVDGISKTGIGVSGTSTSHWGVFATSSSDTALQAQSHGGIGVVGIGTATGVYGQSGSTNGFGLTSDGVRGFTDSNTGSGTRGENAAGGYGVSGHSHTGIGVEGSSDSHWGIAAVSQTDTALQAQSFGGVAVVGVGTATGVYGQSGSTNGFAKTKDGVRGFTDNPMFAGIRGENGAGGKGVSGLTKSDAGGPAAVDGTNDGAGPGMRGAGGTGVLAVAKGSGAVGLQVEGPAVFSTAGTLTVDSGSSKATKTGVTLTSASLVLATMQEHVAGFYVAAAVPDIAAGSFTVYLNKAASKKMRVAWFVVN